MVVNVPFAPMFLSHDCMSEQVDELLYGDEVEITEAFGGFYKIKTDYGYSGWINASDIKKKNVEPNYIVTSFFCDMLFEDRYHLRPAVTLVRGSKIYIEDENGHSRYTTAVMQNNERYYINRSHISPIQTEENQERLRERIIKTAESYLGTQYRWGGRTSLGIDCSGLCFNSYRFNGIDIWRDADITMSENIREIPFCELKKADLMFFKGHIAMYLGGGMIIHSSASSGKVVKEVFQNNEKLKEIYICSGTAF